MAAAADIVAIQEVDGTAGALIKSSIKFNESLPTSPASPYLDRATQAELLSSLSTTQ